MADYSFIVRTITRRHGIRVKRWRTQMSGCAWQVRYNNGACVRWIESPYPRTPISLSIFLHEVGHHAIGFDRYKHRCEEELYAWQWALAAMRELGVEPDEKVMTRYQRSMHYAVSKAMRRGIKTLPASLADFIPRAA